MYEFTNIQQVIESLTGESGVFENNETHVHIPGNQSTQEIGFLIVHGVTGYSVFMLSIYKKLPYVTTILSNLASIKDIQMKLPTIYANILNTLYKFNVTHFSNLASAQFIHMDNKSYKDTFGYDIDIYVIKTIANSYNLLNKEYIHNTIYELANYLSTIKDDTCN